VRAEACEISFASATDHDTETGVETSPATEPEAIGPVDRRGTSKPVSGEIMQAILTSGHTIECANFKAIDSGVVLTADAERKRVIGFVPNERLAFVVPDDRAPELVDVVGSEGVTESGSEATDLDDRLDAIETRLDDLVGGVGEPSTVESGVSITVQEDEAADETGTDVDVVYDERATETTEETGESEKGGDASEETAGEEVESTAKAESTAEELEPRAETEEIERREQDSAAETEEPVEDTETAAEESEAENETAAVRGRSETDETAAVEDETADAEPTAEPEATEPTGTESEERESELTALRGLGPTYAGRLEAAGIETVDDVRAASVEELAEAADVAESRADDWKRQVAE